MSDSEDWVRRQQERQDKKHRRGEALLRSGTRKHNRAESSYMWMVRRYRMPKKEEDREAFRLEDVPRSKAVEHMVALGVPPWIESPALVQLYKEIVNMTSTGGALAVGGYLPCCGRSTCSRR